MTDIRMCFAIGLAGCLVIAVIGYAWLRTEIARYRTRCQGGVRE